MGKKDSSSSDDERKRRKRKRDQDTERRKTKKKEKGVRKRSGKYSRHHSEKRGKSKHNRDHSHEKHDSTSDFVKLSVNDYYAKNNEFATWLKEERCIFFSDLSSEESHKLFSRFVKHWNRQKLPSHYYDGIKSGPRTSHEWKITV